MSRHCSRLISHPRSVVQSARDIAASARCHSSFCPAVCNSLSLSSYVSPSYRTRLLQRANVSSDEMPAFRTF
jgi:hypothetical protein